MNLTYHNMARYNNISLPVLADNWNLYIYIVNFLRHCISGSIFIWSWSSLQFYKRNTVLGNNAYLYFNKLFSIFRLTEHNSYIRYNSKIIFFFTNHMQSYLLPITLLTLSATVRGTFTSIESKPYKLMISYSKYSSHQFLWSQRYKICLNTLIKFFVLWCCI